MNKRSAIFISQKYLFNKKVMILLIMRSPKLIKLNDLGLNINILNTTNLNKLLVSTYVVGSRLVNKIIWRNQTLCRGIFFCIKTIYKISLGDVNVCITSIFLVYKME